ncbi:MAG: hypothetical protein ACXWEW_11555, partial [Nitrososphaeraceae archaeon]
TKNTVFVMGAGASKEAHLPTGYELKNIISHLLDIRFDGSINQKSGDYVIKEAMHRFVRDSDGRNGDINSYLHEAWHIRDALPQAISIDNFIDAHRDNDKIALCGKLAIVRSILEAEKKSLLYIGRSDIDSNINFTSLEKTWYIPFFQLLTENCGKNDLKERFKSITLIIFNYDRCIEHFIYNALINYYRFSGTEAAELVKNINIYHPYGDVGTLPWINPNGVMGFGAEPNFQKLLELSQKIKTFTEGIDTGASEILEIRKHMSIANSVVFLGFAFHKLNMQLIHPEFFDEPNNSEFICFATTVGISQSDKEVIRDQINELYKCEITVRMANLCCGEFFKEYWRSLSF